GEERALGVDARQPRRIERAEGRTGRRHQPAAIRQPHRDVAGRTVSEAAVEQRRADPAALLTKLGFRRHVSLSQAFRKKSRWPKFPDFNASANPGSPTERVHGTPGSISGPISSAVRSRPCTTAPEVSPPATSKRAK